MRPALCKAAQGGLTQQVCLFLSSGTDGTEEKGGETECTPLHIAACAGDLEVVLVFLEHGADVSVQDQMGTRHFITLSAKITKLEWP